MVGLTFTASYCPLLVSCFVLGFFLMAGAPICFQYSAEVSYPAPEATSQGLLLLAGQISGIILFRHGHHDGGRSLKNTSHAHFQ